MVCVTQEICFYIIFFRDCLYYVHYRTCVCVYKYLHFFQPLQINEIIYPDT